MWALVKDHTPGQVMQLLDQYAATLGDEKFRQEVARQIVLTIQLDRSVPASLERFKLLISAALEFFLSCLSQKRLKEAIHELLLNHSESEVGKSIFHLALHFPTLHKLGQVVARRPDIDPDLKRWLVGLEKGSYGSPVEQLIFQIEEELSSFTDRESIAVISELVAEASVAAVIPFRWRSGDLQTTGQGVFKLLKIQVGEKLEEELEALKDTAEFLEKNRERFGLHQLKLAELIGELAEDLRKETDLVTEQQRLVEAREIYREVDRVYVPELLPFCTPTMTAMEFFNGPTVGELALPEKRAFELADLVCRSIICLPLFWKDDQALFHGDPHAGNILAIPRGESEHDDIVLIDWTLAGFLSRAQRMLIMRLLLGILKSDSDDIARTIIGLADDRSSGYGGDIRVLRSDIESHLHLTGESTDDPLVKVFRLLEHAALQGISFPSELVLYRKAFFTLEGVLNDIHPGFVMSDSVERYLRALLLKELPLRSAAWFPPRGDDAASFRSLVSTSDLQSLLIYRTFSEWQQLTELYANMIGVSLNLAMDWLSLMGGVRKD
jgi:ubiquinone biosynthesis protein